MQAFSLVRVHVDDSQVEFDCQAVNDRLEIDVAIADVNNDDAIGLEVAPVFLDGFARQQVHGNRVPTERIQDDGIESLRFLAFQRQSRITRYNFDSRLALTQKTEARLGEINNEWIDFVEAIHIAALP